MIIFFPRGAIIAYFVGAKLYDMSPDYPFWLGAGLVLLSALLVFIFIKEPKTYEEIEQEQPQLFKSLGNILHEKDKSALLILLAILFWFISYSGIEAFFTLYAKEYLGFPASDGARLLGQLSLLFVIFALPAGYLGAAIGRRKTIMTGIVLMAIGIFSTYALSISTLTTVVTKLPVLGNVPIIGLILMGIGIAWALININSLPMVVDMTDEAHNGTFTGLYYLFSTLAAIIGPIMYGWVVQLSGNQYNLLMLVSPIFLVAAFAAMSFVRRGEAKISLPD